MPVTPKIIEKLKSIVGQQHVITDPEALENFAHDETPLYHSMPEVAVKPQNTNEVSQILKLANDSLVPVTARGGGTSLSAGAVPLHAGIVLSFDRMNKIREIDKENLMVIVEPGIITGEFGKQIAQHGLFFPPDPVSLDSCTIGGNIAECAGGPRALKYGVTKNYVTGLEIVLADGTVQKIGGKLLKNVTGYDLIDLIVGSEGTLAIVTETTLKVLPLPACVVDLLIPFKTVAEASLFSIEIINQGLAPAAIELMDGDVIRQVAEYLCRTMPLCEANGHTIVEIDGNDKEAVKKVFEKIGDIAAKMGALDVFVGETLRDRERIWETRKKIGEALKAQTTIIAREDLVVPRNKIPELISRLKNCVKDFGGTLYAFGHLGDGNMHTDVGMKINVEAVHEPPKNRAIHELPLQKIDEMRKKMYQITIDLGGTITAEHGVGLSKIPYLSMALDRPQIELMKKIKVDFDPKNILNPGKIFRD